MDIYNVRLSPGLGTQPAVSFDLGRTDFQKTVDGIFLLLGSCIPGKSYGIFCESLQLTTEQRQILHNFCEKADIAYLKENKKIEVGWEG